MGIQADQVRAILFDIDGTLSDSDDLMVQKVEWFLKPFYYFSSIEKRHSAARWLVMAVESPGNFIYNMADKFGLDSIYIKLINIFSRRKKHRIRKFWIIPRVQEMLSGLSDKFHMGIVSARDERSALAFVRQFGLDQYFSVIVTSQTCKYTKPFPDPLLYAAEKLRIEPKYCLMVGDTTVDIKAAKLAGMQAVGVLCGFGRKGELERAGADMILDSTADLNSFFSEPD